MWKNSPPGSPTENLSDRFPLDDPGHSPDFTTLARLLDDPSPVVREALLVALRGQGEPALAHLRELADRPGEPLAGAAATMLRELGDVDHARRVPPVRARRIAAVGGRLPAL